MPGQASRHITVADLKTDHIGPLLHAAINDIDQAHKELPKKKRSSKESSDALTTSKRKLDLADEAVSKLKKRGIELMAELQKVNKATKEHEETQAEVKKNTTMQSARVLAARKRLISGHRS